MGLAGAFVAGGLVMLVLIGLGARWLYHALVGAGVGARGRWGER